MNRFRWLLWVPMLLIWGWILIQGFSGQLHPDLRLVLLFLAAGCGWLLGRRMFFLFALLLLFLVMFAWNPLLVQPRIMEMISALEKDRYLRISGTVRRTRVEIREGRPWLILLLGESRISAEGVSGEMTELNIGFPLLNRSKPPYRRSEIRVGGWFQGIENGGSQSMLVMSGTTFHQASRPLSAFSGERWRILLMDRAAYYLSDTSLALYLPVMLGIRGASSEEGREIIATIRRVGISHILAISGLHIGLIYLILMAAGHFLSGWAIRHQGWLNARMWTRLAVIGIIWGYIALIGFPVPAVRAAIMGSMLLWSNLHGIHTPRLYILTMAALLILLPEPTLIHDLSFQLSFLSFLFLLSALSLIQQLQQVEKTGGAQSVFRKLVSYSWQSLLVTLVISLGLWPVIASTFGNFSLLVFAGNLLMIPVLSLLVLPIGILALTTSFLSLGQTPEGWLERFVFGLLDLVLQGWVWMIRGIEHMGKAFVLNVPIDWKPEGFFLYYLLTGLLLIALVAVKNGGNTRNFLTFFQYAVKKFMKIKTVN